MPAPRQVFDLDLEQRIGPWTAGRHPGLVVTSAPGQGEVPFTVVPLTTSRPPPPLVPFCVELLVPVPGPNPIASPVWIHACYPVTVPASALAGQPRATLDRETFQTVRNRLAAFLGLR